MCVCMCVCLCTYTKLKMIWQKGDTGWSCWASLSSSWPSLCVSLTCTNTLSVFCLSLLCISHFLCANADVCFFRQNETLFCDLFHCASLSELWTEKAVDGDIKAGVGNAGETRKRRLYFESIPLKKIPLKFYSRSSTSFPFTLSWVSLRKL